MKQLFAFLLMAGILITTTSQVNPPQKKPAPKTLAVVLSEEDWRIVMYVINQSDAPHNTVTKVQEGLVKQLNDSTFQKLHK